MIDDLHGEFARWHEHERGDAGGGSLEQPLHDRDKERQSLASAGLGGGEHIFAFQSLRNDRGLDRSRR